MDNLWRKFDSDSGLPDYMDPTAQKNLADIFGAGTSPWAQAVALLGLEGDVPKEGIISWQDGVPYIHWPYMVSLVSGGAVGFEDGHYTTSYHPRKLWRLMSAQWSVARYVLKTLASPIPQRDDEQITESLALGLAILSLTQRIKGGNEVGLAKMLANPKAAPASLRKTLAQIQAIQTRRTLLSPAWARAFPVTEQRVATELNMQSSLRGDEVWRGIGVCGDMVVGRAVFLSKVSDFAKLEKTNDPLVLVFARARPETVEVFHYAAAVIFGDGGVMSHACTIARESNFPCVTALGQEMVAQLRGGAKVWLRVDPENATVQVVEGH